MAEPWCNDDDITGSYLYFRMNNGRAFDQCFECGTPLCEDVGDYVEDTTYLPTACGPAPDPRWVTLCEDCSCDITFEELFGEDY